jgi:hypothetical protein
LNPNKNETCVTFSVGACAAARGPDEFVQRVERRDDGRDGKAIEAGNATTLCESLFWLQNKLLSHCRNALCNVQVKAVANLVDKLEMCTVGTRDDNDDNDDQISSQFFQGNPLRVPCQRNFEFLKNSKIEKFIVIRSLAFTTWNSKNY